MVVSQVEGAEAGHEIEVRPALGVPQLVADTAHERFDEAAWAPQPHEDRVDVTLVQLRGPAGEFTNRRRRRRLRPSAAVDGRYVGATRAAPSSRRLAILRQGRGFQLLSEREQLRKIKTVFIGQAADLLNPIEVEIAPQREALGTLFQGQHHRLTQAARDNPLVKAEEHRVARHRIRHASQAAREQQHVRAGNFRTLHVGGHGHVDHDGAGQK